MGFPCSDLEDVFYNVEMGIGSPSETLVMSRSDFQTDVDPPITSLECTSAEVVLPSKILQGIVGCSFGQGVTVGGLDATNLI